MAAKRKVVSRKRVARFFRIEGRDRHSSNASHQSRPDRERPEKRPARASYSLKMHISRQICKMQLSVTAIWAFANVHLQLAFSDD
jgi:hypothetical protein